MEIGEKILLHSKMSPDPLDTFVEVTVVESREVAGMWSGKKEFKGYKATDSEGKVYIVNWDSFPDDSMTPYWSWFCKDTNRCWYMVIGYTIRVKSKPPFVKQFPDSIAYCKTHVNLYAPNRGCFDCRFPSPGKSIKKKVAAGPWGDSLVG